MITLVSLIVLTTPRIAATRPPVRQVAFREELRFAMTEAWRVLTD